MMHDTQDIVHLHTIGYGNRTPDELVSVLKANDIKLVVDLRRPCVARIPEYTPSDTPITTGMGKLVLDAGILYVWHKRLANDANSLDAYQLWVGFRLARPYIRALLDTIKSMHPFKSCLLCCEGAAYTADGKANCHRVHVAHAAASILEDLSVPYDIQHL